MTLHLSKLFGNQTGSLAHITPEAGFYYFMLLHFSVYVPLLAFLSVALLLSGKHIKRRHSSLTLNVPTAHRQNFYFPRGPLIIIVATVVLALTWRHYCWCRYIRRVQDCSYDAIMCGLARPVLRVLFYKE